MLLKQQHWDKENNHLQIQWGSVWKKHDDSCLDSFSNISITCGIQEN